MAGHASERTLVNIQERPPQETDDKSESSREYHQMVEAHSSAFKEVCKFIDKEVFYFALYHDKLI